jgi:hypothetical protein
MFQPGFSAVRLPNDVPVFTGTWLLVLGLELEFR